MWMRLFTGLALGLSATACDGAPRQRSDPAQSTGEFATPAAAAAEALTLKTSDDVAVHGTYYRAQNPKALILLFHQAGSNKGEYASIAPRLVEAGYSALAIDQRSGGDMFGARNQTVAGRGRNGSYVEALPDLAAALAWAEDERLPVILWGSSYSASLLFPLVADNPGKAAALLAFSPGEYLGGENTVRRAAAQVDVPVFVTSARDPDEVEAAKAIIAAVPSPRKTQFVPASGGVHGSSTLIPARNPRGAEENWQALLAFLKGIAR
jgi:dienelactone hydrolase